MSNSKEQCQCNDLYVTCEKCVDKACDKILKEVYDNPPKQNKTMHFFLFYN